MKKKIKFKTNIPNGYFEKSPINLIELEKQIKETKIIEKFKDGVVDGLIHGIRDTTQSHHYYQEGYDFGITLYSKQIDEEVENAQTS
tara:strand:- start:248 stop:508 length:261 start_codon:yes stop_codon:yes gene_type:complete